MPQSENFRYMRADDFFANSQPTAIAEDVREAIRLKQGDAPDEETRRRQEDWSRMGQRIVGAEGTL